MESQNYKYQTDKVYVSQEGTVSKKFFANVFTWMFVALGLSTLAAYLFGANAELMRFLITEEGKMSIFGYVAMFSPLALVFLMGYGFSRMSYGALVGVFILYSALTGISLSFILLAYTASSIVGCFAAAAGIFGIMAFLGYTTDVDLSKFRTILMVGLVGIIIASVVNWFLNSSTFDYIISFAGIALFTALTAYDVQKIKRIGEGIEIEGDQVTAVDSNKIAIVAALTLYLDFLNLFLFILRIFGDRK